MSPYSQQISILVVEDEEILRYCYSRTLAKYDNFSIVGTAKNGAEAIEMVRTHLPNVVLMDIIMPVMSGITATRRIKNEFPEIKILGFTAKEDMTLLRKMIDAGVSGFVQKTGLWAELHGAILSVAGGGNAFSGRIIKEILRSNRTAINEINNKVTLTKREAEILDLLTDNLDTKAIADRLHIGIRAVNKHRKRLKEKLIFHEHRYLTNEG